MEENRQTQIHKKGFNLINNSPIPTEYNSIKIGTKTLDDATLNLGSIEKVAKFPISKEIIYRALDTNDVSVLREISNYFYKVSGIYQRSCNYAATLYRYDWYLSEEYYSESVNNNKVIQDTHQLLKYFDHSYIPKLCGDIALAVVRQGAYYGYIVSSKKGLMMQELPINYCRSRHSVNGLPAIEFNMRFFDEAFPDPVYRRQVIDLFPAEFKKGYELWKKGKLSSDGVYNSLYGWYQLDPNNTAKFNFSNGTAGGPDIPLFINAIPAIIDLDAAQALDRKKQMQKLLKVIVQKLPLDKNGDLIFDNDEARDIHNNAVQMLKRAIGVDVLTTFADIESIDMSDKNTTATQDDLAKCERAVFNSMGISKNVFNTDGNLSLEKSIANDEGSLRSLLLQFETFFDRVAQNYGSSQPKKYGFRFYMLPTTQYNYKELAKLYKEQTQLGFSKILPQIALGHSQSFILNSIHFENDVLNLSESMIPPLMSSTMSMEDLNNRDKSGKSQTTQTTQNTESGEAGRPEKAESEKSDKTLANESSKG